MLFTAGKTGTACWTAKCNKDQADAKRKSIAKQAMLFLIERIPMERYILHQEIRQDKKRRLAFDRLAQKTFGISFENWHQAGYWQENYRPYTLFDGEKAVCNVSVNPMTFCLNGEEKRYIQLGTVMTDEAYRKQGLCCSLMETVLEEWIGKCDGIYLIANHTVLDFYPKFGFSRFSEYQQIFPVTPKNMQQRKLDLQNNEDLSLLKRLYDQANPFSILQGRENFSLLMFYCMGPCRDSISYLPELDLAVITETEGSVLHCLEILGKQNGSLAEILGAVAPEGVTTAVLGFPLGEAAGGELQQIGDDDALFWLSGIPCPFAAQKMMFPLLTHA